MTRADHTNRQKPARIGDVLEFAVDASSVAYGHVLARHELLDFYVGVFAGVYERGKEPEIDRLPSTGYALLGHTADSLVRAGEWRVVGRLKPDPTAFPLPRFKRWDRGPDGPVFAVSWDEQSSEAAPEEVSALLPMTSHDPAKFQLAARALQGLDAWRPEYDDLRIERVAASHGRGNGGGPHGETPLAGLREREVPAEEPTILVGLFLFEGQAERGREAERVLRDRGWSTTFFEDEELVEATRRGRWADVEALSDDVEALARELGATDSGYEYSVPT